MKPTDIFNWSPALAVRPNEELITIEVGPARDQYKAHKRVLVDRSTFFANALGNEVFEETRTGVITLPEANSPAFALWLDWAYQGKISSLALDIRLERDGIELSPGRLYERRQVASAASWWFMIGATPKTVIADICNEFLGQKQTDPCVPACKVRIFKDIAALPSRLDKKDTALKKLIQEVNNLLDAGARTDDLSAQECRELKSSFQDTCEAKILAAQGDPILTQNFIGQTNSQPHVDEAKRPAFTNLIHLYHLSDYLLSESCKNLVIDAVAELASYTKFVPNAVDVGELWGFDDEIGDLDELTSPEKNRDLKQLVRHIYCSKNTSRLLMEEQDPYPEPFLREISVLSRSSNAVPGKWDWTKPSLRCQYYHAHTDSPRCMRSRGEGCNSGTDTSA